MSLPALRYIIPLAMDSDLLRGYVCKDKNGTLSIACRCCDLKFKQLYELREHISKMISEIPELPDKCLTKIFRYLTPNQLVNVSRVSRKFKLLAERVFEMYFDPGPIQMKYDVPHGKYKDNPSVQCNFECRSKYETVFASSIRRLMIPLVCTSYGGFEKLFQFIRENCCKELTSLVFYNNLSGLTSPNRVDCRVTGKIAKDQLKQLEYLRVEGVRFEYLYDELLRYTEHLKSLTVINRCFRHDCDRNCRHFGYSWTKRGYPELETICFYTENNRFDLMPMIRRHPKLRNVVCNSTATIRSICRQSDIQFNFVGMILKCGDDERITALWRLYQDIVKFGRSKRFETFELCLEDDRRLFRLVESIPNLTGLHVDITIEFRKEQVQPSIQKLCINFGFYYSHKNDKELLQDIDEKFPNLKELRINVQNVPWWSPYGADLKCFNRFARDALYNVDAFKNLKQLHYENDDYVELTWDNVVDINFIRSKRPNPSKILVYLDPVHFHKFNKNVVELEFIEIKPWVHGGCELCIRWAFQKW